MKLLFSISLIFLFACQKEVMQPSSINQQTADDIRLIGQESFPMEFLVFDSCTNEWVLFKTVAEYKFNIGTQAGNANFKTTSQFKQGNGIGLTSGSTYKLIGGSVEIERFKDFENTSNESVRLNSRLRFATPGGGNDLVVDAIKVRRIAADGTVVIDTEEQTTTCK